MKKYFLITLLIAAFSFESLSEVAEPERKILFENPADLNIVQKQDSIVRRDGKVILGTVKEIGTSEIKYSNPEFNSDLLFSIPKSHILKIVFSNGKVQQFERQADLMENIEQNSAELFQIQKKNALKIDFLGFVGNTFSLTYERCLKPSNSIEFSLGVVGLGFANMGDNASGILFRGGYKLIRNPEFYLKGMRYSHILKGRYVKMEFDFASYRVEGTKDIFTSNMEKYNMTKWAVLMVFGNQWVFNDNFVIDLYSGIGIGSNNLDEIDSSYPYGFTTLGQDFPLALSFGLRIGFLLKNKAPKPNKP